jgi:hypothetical protein
MEAVPSVTPDVVAQARLVRLRLSVSCGYSWPRGTGWNKCLHHDGTATVGHLVEAVGMSLTEVGALLAGSMAVSPAHRPPAGVAAQLH